jgi:hypothetical protein
MRPLPPLLRTQGCEDAPASTAKTSSPSASVLAQHNAGSPLGTPPPPPIDAPCPQCLRHGDPMHAKERLTASAAAAAAAAAGPVRLPHTVGASRACQLGGACVSVERGMGRVMAHRQRQEHPSQPLHPAQVRVGRQRPQRPQLRVHAAQGRVPPPQPRRRRPPRARQPCHQQRRSLVRRGCPHRSKTAVRQRARRPHHSPSASSSSILSARLGLRPAPSCATAARTPSQRDHAFPVSRPRQPILTSDSRY